MSRKKGEETPQDWSYRDYMYAKHQILSKYIGTWMRILYTWNDELVYFDGFAGKGRFDTGEEGSPIIVLKQALRNIGSDSAKKFTAFFVERDASNCKLLEKELKSLNLPNNIKYFIENKKFENVLDEFKTIFKNKETTNSPIFFFLDPFGYSPISLEDLKFILSLNTCEFFLTFMYRDLNRFIEAEHLKDTHQKVLGIKDFSPLIKNAKSVKERENIIVASYRKQISEYVKAEFSSFFCVKNRTSFTAPTLYYLVHATNKFRGLQVMKDVMNSVGGESYTYYGSLKKTTLEEMFGVFKQQIKQYLYDNFPKKIWLDYKIIKKKIYIDTPYINKHCNSSLKEFEKEGIVRIKRVASKKYGIKEGDYIMIL